MRWGVVAWGGAMAAASSMVVTRDVIPNTYANPWIDIVMDGIQKRMLLSPKTQGIVLFNDMGAAEQKYRNSQVSATVNGQPVQTMVKIVRRPSHAHIPWKIDGVIGVGIKSTRTEHLWPYVNRSDSNTMQYTYNGMDYATGAASLEFGASPDTVVWSEPMNAADDYFYQRFTSFPIFHLSVCGTSLTQATSTYWNAIVDFHRPCLTLPKEFYSTLLAWAPLKYNATANITVVHSGISVEDLPSLRFQLSHFSPVLSLPLSTLALPTDNSSSTLLCIQPGYSVKRILGGHLTYTDVDEDVDAFAQSLIDTDNLKVPNMYRSPIVLGTMALQSLGLIVHAKDTRIGFRPSSASTKLDSEHDRRGTCKAAVTCTGDQTYRADLNKCQDPNCDRYLNRRFDPATKTCVVTASWVHCIVLVVGAIVSFEVYFEVMRQRLSRQVLAGQAHND
ncbi:hypothetical protein H310_01380 [Aphanomyces invadans]|uniref:Peptidase A1 domain-containing protein n=1 Tax=Aphanomyces invadans TaxID=157072 RepID=A0A024UR39_9STRA|nr:hypothetical protein H310_01380 [Aphanomyces invadans]ETW08886.1 hypothetical protein H310_01380 [Aphanomyces invadans]|eukprot:XP_008862691.1 hypothetical protein H310_01380 [Aphanomyces invadans]